MLALALALSLTAAPPKALQDKFSKLGLAWNPPSSFKDAPAGKTGALPWDLALRSPDKKFEVRVVLRPTGKATPDAGSDDLSAQVKATLLTLSAGGQQPTLKPFSAKTLAKEFAADQGVTAYIDPKLEGWSSYTHCMMYALRSIGRGEVWVYFLFDDFEEVKGPVLEAFHLVKFEK